MYPQLLVSFVLINFVVANDQNSLKYGEEKSSVLDNKNMLVGPLWKQHIWKPSHTIANRNVTYIDKTENMIRLPTLNKLEEKKRTFKKSPKRTIQKIIKKNRQKSKKIYVIKMTSPTVSPENYENGQEELSQWKDDSTTMQTNLKRKPRKYNTKIARYPMPFQRLQKLKSHKKDKRDAYSREK